MYTMQFLLFRHAHLGISFNRTPSPPLNMTQAFYMEMDFLFSFSGLRILPSTFSDWFGCGINSEGKPILRPKLKASSGFVRSFSGC